MIVLIPLYTVDSHLYPLTDITPTTIPLNLASQLLQILPGSPCPAPIWHPSMQHFLFCIPLALLVSASFGTKPDPVDCLCLGMQTA